MPNPEATILRVFSQRTQSVAIVLIGLGGFAAAVIGAVSLAQSYTHRQVLLVVSPLVAQGNVIHAAQDRRFDSLEVRDAMQQAVAAELYEQVQALRDAAHLPRIDGTAFLERVRRAAEFNRRVAEGAPAPPALKAAPLDVGRAE